MSTNRFDIKTPERVYQNLVIEIVIKYIEQGRFLENHLISPHGEDSWQELHKNALTAHKFGAAQTPSFVVEIKDSYGEITSADSEHIPELIQEGKLKETSYVRLSQSADWAMAGDVEKLDQYFQFRRKQHSAPGGPQMKIYVDNGPAFYTDLGSSITFFSHSNFWYNLVAIFVLTTISALPFFGPLGKALNVMIMLYFFSYAFRILDRTSEGDKHFPEWGDFSDLIGELVRPAISFTLSRLVGLAPLLFFFYKDGDIFSFAQVVMEPYSVLFDRSPNALIIAGFAFYLLYFPISLMRQAAYGEFLPAWNVVAIVISIKRAFGPYLIMILLVALVQGFATVSVLFAADSAPFVGGAPGLFVGSIIIGLLQTLSVVGLFLIMYIKGRFLAQNRLRMGWK